MSVYLDSYAQRIMREISHFHSVTGLFKNILYMWNVHNADFWHFVCFNGSVAGKEQLARASGKDKLVRTSVGLVSPFIDTSWLYGTRILYIF